MKTTNFVLSASALVLYPDIHFEGPQGVFPQRRSSLLRPYHLDSQWTWCPLASSWTGLIPCPSRARINRVRLVLWGARFEEQKHNALVLRVTLVDYFYKRELSPRYEPYKDSFIGLTTFTQGQIPVYTADHIRTMAVALKFSGLKLRAGAPFMRTLQWPQKLGQRWEILQDRSKHCEVGKDLPG